MTNAIMPTDEQLAAAVHTPEEFEAAREKALARQFAAAAMSVLPPDLDDLKKLATIYVESGYFPSVKSAAQAIVKILAGRELGLSPFASMRGVYMFDGNLGFYAATMQILLRRAGYRDRIIESTATRCEIEFTFQGEPCGPNIVWTIEMAKTAGLVNKDNWKNYPQDLLFNRAMASGCRKYAPEIFAGASAYTVDELQDMQSVTFLEGRANESTMAAATEEKGAALRQRMAKARPVTAEVASDPDPDPTPEPEGNSAPDLGPTSTAAQEPETKQTTRGRKAAQEPSNATAKEEVSGSPETAPWEPESATTPEPEPAGKKLGYASEQQIRDLVITSFKLLHERKGAPQTVPPFANIQKVFEVGGYQPPQQPTDGPAKIFETYWRIEYQTALKASKPPGAFSDVRELFGK